MEAKRKEAVYVSDTAREYGQLYGGLVNMFPKIGGGAPLVPQFAAMPLEADWLHAICSSYADIVSPSRGGFYFVGGSRVSQAYYMLLSSVDPVRGESIRGAVDRALDHMGDYGSMMSGLFTEDYERWQRRTLPLLRIEVDTSVPCENDWTRLCGDGAGTGGLSGYFGDSPCRYTFTAMGAGVYEVLRYNWYVDSFASPSFPIIEGGTLSTEDFFGERGALQHIPLKLAVVWNTQITMRLSHRALRGLQAVNTNALGPAPGLLGLDFDINRLEILPQSNGEDAGTIPVALNGSERPQVWLVQSSSRYLKDVRPSP